MPKEFREAGGPQGKISRRLCQVWEHQVWGDRFHSAGLATSYLWASSTGAGAKFPEPSDLSGLVIVILSWLLLLRKCEKWPGSNLQQ